MWPKKRNASAGCLLLLLSGCVSSGGDMDSGSFGVQTPFGSLELRGRSQKRASLNQGRDWTASDSEKAKD